jgi:cytochrome c biogenesis protein
MATSETEATQDSRSAVVAKPEAQARLKKSESVLDKFLGLLSSVRFGVTMLVILLICSIIGMLVMQVQVEGFQDYYRRITPAQRLVFGKLGFFDIYHSWYFTLLLAITGLNIILASIDRFPSAWQYVVKPKLNASPNFIRAQNFNVEAEVAETPGTLVESIRKNWRAHGFRARVNEERGRITVFAQKNTWNRLGAYVVHVALLTIFTGGFLTNRYGVGGSMEIRPGRTTNTFTKLEMKLDGQFTEPVTLPFSIECTDLQQKLIRPEGNLEATNTIDWLSYFKIKDGGFEQDVVAHLNNPVDYRGYRFFQSAFQAVGNARSITISFEPVEGGPATIPPVTIPRGGAVEVQGIGKVSYTGFFPDFEITEGGPTTSTGDYNKPVAQLEIVMPDGKKRLAFAFNPATSEEYITKAEERVGKDGEENPLLVNGNKIVLKDFEKVALGHTLAVQYDPGRTPVYIGFTLLVLALCGVFFFSHQRVWAVVEPHNEWSKVYFGGSTNRNKPAFEGRFNLLVRSVIGGRPDNE